MSQTYVLSDGVSNLVRFKSFKITISVSIGAGFRRRRDVHTVIMIVFIPLYLHCIHLVFTLCIRVHVL